MIFKKITFNKDIFYKASYSNVPFLGPVKKQVVGWGGTCRYAVHIGSATTEDCIQEEHLGPVPPGDVESRGPDRSPCGRTSCRTAGTASKRSPDTCGGAAPCWGGARRACCTPDMRTCPRPSGNRAGLSTTVLPQLPSAGAALNKTKQL